MTALNEPTTKLDAEIDAQKSRVANADRDLRKAKNRLRELQLDKVRVEFGIVIGGIVKDRDGKLYRIADIEISWQSPPWIHGHPQKKDGTFGTAIRNLHSDWTRPANKGRTTMTTTPALDAAIRAGCGEGCGYPECHNLGGSISCGHGDPESGENRGKALWHGWRCRMMDYGVIPVDAGHARLVHEYIEREGRRRGTHQVVPTTQGVEP